MAKKKEANLLCQIIGKYILDICQVRKIGKKKEPEVTTQILLTFYNLSSVFLAVLLLFHYILQFEK